MNSTHDSEYSQALRAAIKQRLRGETTVADYLARCEHLAAVHDRMADRARFAKERAELEVRDGRPNGLAGLSLAPWTPMQVAVLNAFQAEPNCHPFTCGRNSSPLSTEAKCPGVLIAKSDGWRCPVCDYRQGWCHNFMLDPAATQATREARELVGDQSNTPSPWAAVLRFAPGIQKLLEEAADADVIRKLFVAQCRGDGRVDKARGLCTSVSGGHIGRAVLKVLNLSALLEPEAESEEGKPPEVQVPPDIEAEVLRQTAREGREERDE